MITIDWLPASVLMLAMIGVLAAVVAADDHDGPDSPAAARQKALRIQRSLAPGEVKDIAGFVGHRLRVNRENYLKRFDIDSYVEMVRRRDHTDWGWIGEQDGKWLESAILTAGQSGDADLQRKARSVLAEIVATQEPDGYVGVTPKTIRTPAKPLRGMDPYELYFTLHAFITAYEQWGYASSLTAARKLGDYFVDHIGPGKAEFWPSPYRPPENVRKIICEQFTWVPEGTTKAPTLHVYSEIAGHTAHYCWEGTLLIDPMLRLYQVTGDPRYLDWSRWVIGNIDRWSGWDSFSRLDLVAQGKLGIHELQPYVHAHTFQMNFLGFLRMYEITGDRAYLDKVAGAYDDVVSRQLYITGGVSVGEHYEADSFKPVTGDVVETCANMSWLELNQYLLELTGQPRYADLIEKLLWNHVFAAQTADGDCYRYHTPPNGAKPHEFFRDPCCCTGSGHRMVSMLPSVIYAAGKNRVYVNQFVASRAGVQIGGTPVQVSQETDYPEGERVTIRIDTDQPVRFELLVRLPAWCATPSAVLNGRTLSGLKCGTYHVLDRKWKTGDTLELNFPMRLHWQQSDGGERQPPSVGSERRWALIRGPMVYAADTVVAADSKTARLDPGTDVGISPCDEPAYSRIDLPAGALGPGFAVPVTTSDGCDTALAFWPFANVGSWYRPGEQKPAPNSAAYRYAAWLLARDSSEFLERRVKAITTADGDGPLELRLHPETQTAAYLAFRGSDRDLTPDAPELGNLQPGFQQLGDVTLRYRRGDEPWRQFATAARKRPAEVLEPDEAGVLQAADLSGAGAEPMPLELRRKWLRRDQELVMRFELRNPTEQPVEIGAFGTAMVFNNFFNEPIHGDHRLIHERRFYAQPYVGGDAGYLQVTRVDGRGPVLLVLPGTNSGFEAYRHMTEHPFRRNVDFEGFYEWTVHSRAYTEKEWPAKRQWNPATSRVLKPGETAVYEFLFVMAPSVREVEATLAAHGRPVVIGIPGYVLPLGETGRLFVKAGSAIDTIAVIPPNAMDLLPLTGKTGTWQGYAVAGKQPGRCRVEIAYRNGRRQYVHYNVIPSQAEQVKRLAAFHDARQWFADPGDRYGRTYAYMPYDREAKKMVLDEPRVFISGLSDEPGAGANLLMAMKNLHAPTPNGVARLEQYVDGPLWGRLQNKGDYSIRASLFYGPPGCWDEARSKETWRASNYRHQTAIYRALYRLARNHQGLVTHHAWDWYLRQAFRTAMAMKRFCGPGTGDGNVSQLEQWGLMVGSVFPELLADLRHEGWKDEANEMEAYMRYRAEIWNGRPYPFGSEMPWGPTSQEEIFAWCDHFGFLDKARLSLDTIIAGAPVAPNWGYNGSMHFYFAAFVYGKWPRLERELHWYLSSLCAGPLLDAFRKDPKDLHLLRIGYAGATGVLGNINADGHGSMSFHATPDLMEFDPYSSDYGCHFYGYCRNAGAYVVKHDDLGWLGFGCDVTTADRTVLVTPRDAFRQRVFLAPPGLWLTLESGRMERVAMDLAGDEVTVTLAAAEPHTSMARLSADPVHYRPVEPLPLVRGAWEIVLGRQPVPITLRRQQQPVIDEQSSVGRGKS